MLGHLFSSPFGSVSLLHFSLTQDKEEQEGEIKLKLSLTFTCKITDIVNISS